MIKFRTLKGKKYTTGTGSFIEALNGSRYVTRIGLFLRETGLDELPQLFNVLRGDMSLVGPRPHAVVMDVILTKKIARYLERYAVKPGIIGWAQVNGSRGPAMAPSVMRRRLELDLWYIQHRSFWLDVKIFALALKELLIMFI